MWIVVYTSADRRRCLSAAFNGYDSAAAFVALLASQGREGFVHDPYMHD